MGSELIEQLRSERRMPPDVIDERLEVREKRALVGQEHLAVDIDALEEFCEVRVELSRGLHEAIELREDGRDALRQLGGRRVRDVIGNQPDQSLEPTDEGREKLA